MTKPASVPEFPTFVEFGKCNVEALLEAGSTLFHGVEALTRSVFELTETQLQANVSAVKALAGIRSLGELGDLQRSYSRTAFDNVMSEASLLSEIVIRVSNEALEPLSARLQASLDRLPKPALAV